MNVKIATFIHPFSFFCVPNNDSNNETCEEFKNDEAKSSAPLKDFMSDVNHAQYVLVMWNNKWSRGVVDMQNQFLIWLIDYGIFIRPNDKTVYIDIPSQYKKFPSKVFEASIHGVVPLDTILNIDCEIINKRISQWNLGSIEQAQVLIKNATKTVFHPIAILTTKYNDIVLGDLILHIPGLGTVNLIDELEKWPKFLERDRSAYIKDLSTFYITRRLHRACVLKPCFKNYDLPYLTMQNVSVEYFKLANTVKNKLQGTSDSDSSNSTDGDISTTVCNDMSALKITLTDIEKYSKKYVILNDRSYNVLNILINKGRDLRMCEQYKNHDRKSVGRACFYSRSLNL